MTRLLALLKRSWGTVAFVVIYAILALILIGSFTD